MSRTLRAHLPNRLAAIIICVFFAGGSGMGAAHPVQPTRITVSAPVGGLGDIAAQIVARKLSEAASYGASSASAGAAPFVRSSFALPIAFAVGSFCW
jgi:hypothetical protein